MLKIFVNECDMLLVECNVMKWMLNKRMIIILKRTVIEHFLSIVAKNMS